MPAIKKLFSNEGVKSAAIDLARKLDRFPDDDKDRHSKAKQIALVLNIFSNNAEAIDAACQVNIDWIGSSLISRMQNLGNPSAAISELEEFAAILYRFVVEFDMSMKDELSMELRQFQIFMRDNLEKFSGSARDQIIYARQEMPIQILKQLLNSDEITNLRNIPALAKDVDQKFSNWETSLSTHEKKVSDFQSSLKSYETAFNFVGLYDGFNELVDQKKKEQKWLRRWMIFFGVLIFLPLIAELFFFNLRQNEISSLSPYILVGMAVVSLSLTVLLVYFFRIALRSADACKAQLLQLELRKTLCRFIQSYATYSTDLKAKNPDSLAKFENLIFSGIVSSDDKLPSTFDGVDQMAGLIKAMRAK